jgi:hypothetical protein
MAAGSTYTPIATTTISGTSTATVTFNSFSGYTDVRLIVSVKSNSGSADLLKVAVNTSSSISRTGIYGNGTAAGSYRQSSEPVLYVDDVPASSSASYNLTTFDFMNYSNTTTYKTVLSRLNNTSAGTRAQVYLVPSTSAITTLTLTMNSGSNIGDGSTFTLYGIAAA